MVHHNYKNQVIIENTLLQKHYDCHITDTNERRLLTNVGNWLFPPDIDDIEDGINYQVECIFNIKIAERDFYKLLSDMECNRSILDNMHDPVVRDMYEKLLIYIKLKT